MLFLRVSFCTSFAVLFCGERAEAFNPSLFFNQGFRSSFRRRQSPSAVSSLLSVVEEEGQGEASESLLESPRPSLESRKERLRRASRDVLLSGAALLSVPSLTSLSPSPAWASELEGVVSPVEERGTSSLLLSEGPSADIYSVPGGVDKAWYQLDLDTEETLFDLDFDSAEPSHGFLVGTRGIIYETNNGGRSWKQRSLTVLEEEEEEGFRFQQVSFRNGECWIIGQPPILLHSTNGGKTWERVRLSPKLPGAPYGIVALGPNAAEMTTNTGAIYTTDNGGKNWKAQVRETIDATLNRVSSSGVQGASYYSGSVVSQYRDGGGNYVAIGSRGNFWLTWAPGQAYWFPHNRGSSRRIQAMGFIKDDTANGIWMTLNGGVLQLCKKFDVKNLSVDIPNFEKANIRTGGYGIIDVAWKDDNEVWAVGGSGSLWSSRDGGKNFKFNASADNIRGNLYRCKFYENKRGFVLGSDGVLLRYAGKNV